jgi:hypothetical protein
MSHVRRPWVTTGLTTGCRRRQTASARTSLPLSAAPEPQRSCAKQSLAFLAGCKSLRRKVSPTTPTEGCIWEGGATEQHRGRVHRAPRRPQERPPSLQLVTAPFARLMQTAMVGTPQKPPQRTRCGECPEGLPGSTTRVVCVARSARNGGDPDGSWGANPR